MGAMKYIRTQKELYKVMSKQICNTDKFVEVQRKKVGLFTGTTELISKEDVLKQADTIEELCDEVVIIYPDGSHSVSWCYDYKSFYESIEGQVGNLGKMPYTKENLVEYEIYEIYGAIWTEWGLKYVAKMNEKGELELL